MTKEQKLLVLLILLVSGAGAGIYFATKKPAASKVDELPRAVETTTGSSTAASAQNDKAPQVPPTTSFANVTMPHMSSQEYVVPGEGKEAIEVTLYVKDGTIEDLRFSYAPASKRESVEYLNSFNKAIYKQGLIGKKVKDVSLSRVGGASLTTAAFMKAVNDISTKISG